jgi:hypothetical protein
MTVVEHFISKQLLSPAVQPINTAPAIIQMRTMGNADSTWEAPHHWQCLHTCCAFSSAVCFALTVLPVALAPCIVSPHIEGDTMFQVS